MYPKLNLSDVSPEVMRKMVMFTMSTYDDVDSDDDDLEVGGEELG